MANNYVSDEERDQRLGELLKHPDNKICFDCKSKNPKWASSTIGIFICYQCTTKHRQMGTHISFCRSIHMDRWKAKEVKIMELGGNKKAHAFYSKNSMYSEGIPNHTNPLLAKYKTQLQKSALAELGDSGATAAKPVAVPVSATTNEEGKDEDDFISSLASKPPASVKVPSSEATSSSIYSFTNLKQGNQPKNLNAKKLDIDFGGDDFFDSFGMAESDPIGSKQSETKNIATSENPFAVAGNDEPGPFQLGSGTNTHSREAAQNDEFIKNKLKELEGKKAISSEDFKQTDDAEHKERFARFSGATAISSADFFGEEKKDDSSQGRGSVGSFNRDSIGEKMSEAAIYAADTVASQAKKLKEKATNFWSSLRSSDASTK